MPVRPPRSSAARRPANLPKWAGGSSRRAGRRDALPVDAAICEDGEGSGNGGRGQALRVSPPVSHPEVVQHAGEFPEIRDRPGEAGMTRDNLLAPWGSTDRRRVGKEG